MTNTGKISRRTKGVENAEMEIVLCDRSFDGSSGTRG
jgi:hypothetical protein